MPPRRKKEKKPKMEFPDDISDISAYLAKVTDKLVAAAQQVSDATDATSSSGSSYGSSYSSSYHGRPVTGNVIPGSPGSPRVRMVEEFMRHTDESGDWLQKWYSDNYEKVENYEYIRFELLYFLNDYMPGIRVDENIDARNLVELVKELVLDFQTKVNRFNLELREISGHEIAGYIQDHHRKVLEVVDDYENKLKSANEEVALYKSQIAHLDAELSAVQQRMMYLERGTAYYGGFEDSVTEEQFMADLQSRVAHSHSLNSSMKEELQRERQQNEGLQRHLAHLAREKVEIEEKCMEEIVELSKRAEINSALEHGIRSMLEGGAKEPNRQDCQNLIDQWKNEINQVIDQNSKEIDELLKRVQSQNNEIAMLQAQANEQDEKLEKMQRKVQNKQSLFDKYKAEATSLQTHVDEFKKVIEELHHESYGLESFWGRGGAVPDDYNLDAYNLDEKLIGPIDGEIPEYDLLSETVPIRWGQRQRRRRREPIYASSGSVEGASSAEEQPLPMGGLGVIRLEDEDEWEAVGPRSPSQRDVITVPRGQLRFVDGQWIEVEGSAPQAAPQYEPPRGAGLMGPVRLDQAGSASVGGRQSPIEQVQAGGAMRLIDGQWVSAGPRSPQRPSPPRLHSTLREQGPVRTGGISPGPDISSIRPASPRARTPPRLEVPGMRLTTQRAGTAHRLGASSMGPATARARAPPRVGASGMRPASTRLGTPPRVGASGMRPAATRPGTPPRPRVPTQRPTAQRVRIPQRSAIPNIGPTAPRARIPQRPGATSMLAPAATSADALMSRVMLLSPQRQEPLALDVDVAPRSITPTGEDFVCEVAVGVQPAPPEDGGQNVHRDRRARQPRPHFTPRAGFQR